MPLIIFVIVLLVLLVAMGIFRSPAVALMPDVTLKPLRSKANAIINLMGNAGGIIVLLLGMGFAFGISKAGNAMMSYTPYYLVIAGTMVAALIIFLCTVREKEWAAQMQSDAIRYGVDEKDEATEGTNKKLSKGQMFSLICILLSVALWYFGYNAVTSKYSVYAPNVLLMGYSETMLIAQACAIVSYLPAGMIASKIGRKKTILAGVTMLTVAFTVAAFMRASSPAWLMYIMFALAGIAWATINVNSFPMVVEMCSGSDVGKYTGFYYTASMAAQTLTPMLSGFLMDRMGMTVLFPYAAIFVALAFVTMLMVKHGDAKVIAKKGLEALDIED
jgi:MFS family permease